MSTLSIHQLSAPSGEFLEPPQSSKPITASGFELRHGFIAMVREQPFSGYELENPYHHLQELRNRFCLAFFPISRIASLRKEILDFRQDEKETLGTA